MKNIFRKICSSLIALLIWPTFAIVFLIAAFLYIIVTLFISSRRLYPLAKILSRLILLSAGQRLKFVGKMPHPQTGPYLYLFNHQSMLDHFAIAAGINEYISAVGAAFQFSWPIWGMLIKRIGVIPIVNTDLTKAIHSLSLAEYKIREGTSFLISPEGTRTVTGKMGLFKKGAFHLALNTGVTIVPIGLMGAYAAKKRFDWRIYPGKIIVNIGQLVQANYYNQMTVEELRDDIRKRIAELCKDDLVVKNTECE